MCYDMMHQIELFQEHIHDYEEIISRIQSPVQYQNLAKIYRQLGNCEKAVELEEKVKSLKTSGGHGRVINAFGMIKHVYIINLHLANKGYECNIHAKVHFILCSRRHCLHSVILVQWT